ncbi:ATP-grasp ribosomal peptide maturase [Streptomyces sp. JB150]|uniref:ATP-grasp ribosomal peptide maturase n=1 Tax=Streptomyces sp. JB150 TaxID=2714844 RepID=UPI00140826E4|nr:ATP-grasp ribosomal peptide maturase [Streptomyces sp. JB150]QIJ62529.1 ATP-grasp ribosomal peptide maturase [Streptomyces sp. JB150]
MTAPVLIVAAADDWPTDRVVVELDRRGVEVFRMDTADFPQRLALAGRIDQRQAWTGVLTTEHRTVELSRVGAVYYRAPGAFRFPQGMSGPEERFAAAQARAGLGGVLSALDCRWVNHPTTMARAEYKPVQLAAARACGLRIPATLITNRPEDVLAFAAELRADIVCKPIASPVLIEEGQLKTVYTRLLTSSDLADLRGISTTAHLFQEWIAKEYEVRLTVVGDRMFAAAIHAGSDASHEDWRSDYGALTYTTTTVPAGVAAGMRRLMNRLQLRYGAADFIVGPEGWTFLEVNPCGQWDWIQGATGLPIVEAIADELQGVS